ncbi:MAG: hypothetical protein K8S97_13900 [Anaerolineae bacterium]|nr:hypothetical protein [Anaerolineae bacterium]
MADAAQIPPLQGCLYCHVEGTLTRNEGRKILGLGSDYPTVKCSHCESVALLDVNPDAPAQWRIRYRRVNHAPQYYYVALHLGAAGWLSAEDALAISTNGFVQRQRTRQATAGDLHWLHAAPLNPPLPLMTAHEVVYLTLKGVTLQEAAPSGLLTRSDHGTLLDSGKCYITDQKLHLLGQRRDWSHPISDVQSIAYDQHGWTLLLASAETAQQYRGVNSPDQFDAQLVAEIVRVLSKNSAD